MFGVLCCPGDLHGTFLGKLLPSSVIIDDFLTIVSSLTILPSPHFSLRCRQWTVEITASLASSETRSPAKRSRNYELRQKHAPPKTSFCIIADDLSIFRPKHSKRNFINTLHEFSLFLFGFSCATLKDNRPRRRCTEET